MENQLIREQVFDVLFNYVKRADGIYTESDCATVRDEICLQIDQSQFTADEAEEHINQEVEKRIAERDELIVLLNAYATFLGKIIDKHATFLMVHGIKASDDEIKMGQKYRDDINRIISRLVSQKTEGGGE